MNPEEARGVYIEVDEMPLSELVKSAYGRELMRRRSFSLDGYERAAVNCLLDDFKKPPPLPAKEPFGLRTLESNPMLDAITLIDGFGSGGFGSGGLGGGGLGSSDVCIGFPTDINASLRFKKRETPTPAEEGIAAFYTSNFGLTEEFHIESKKENEFQR